MRSHYEQLVEYVERCVPAVVALQRTDGPDAGGFVRPERGYAEPGSAASCIDLLTSAYCCPESTFFRDRTLITAAQRYAEHLVSHQHPDGTIDLRETNFHDATAVAFSVQYLAYTVRLLDALGKDADAVATLRDTIVQFLQRGGEGMVAGGFHTPNHRWIMASALALLYAHLGEPRYKEEVERYLAEGIDCSPVGEYTERSVGIYNPAVNRSLMIIAEELEKPELLVHVERNLRMVLRYVEPDGTLCTLNSRRQDAGMEIYPTAYYDNYLLMAHRTGDREFAAMADQIMAHLTDSAPSLNGAVHRTTWSDVRILTQHLLRRDLRGHALDSQPLPAKYRLVNPDSGIVRLRNGSVSATVLAAHPVFLKVQNGRAWVQLRLAATFYGEKGQLLPQEVREENGQFVMEYRRRWGYVRPLESAPDTAEWDAMDHARRERVLEDDFIISAAVTPEPEGVTVRLVSQGVAGVLWRIEMMVPANGFAVTEGLTVPAVADGWALCRGDVTYERMADAVTVSGGTCRHRFARELRGGQEPQPGVFTLYYTGFTPMDETITIRGTRSQSASPQAPGTPQTGSRSRR